MRGAGIHRRPSRFPCALRPETGGATGRKNLFFPLPLFSELVKVLKIFDFNGVGHPSWVSRTHPFFPSRKSPLAALRLFPLLGFSAHTLHPQGVCGIRRAAKPLTAALPYRRGEFTTLSTVSAGPDRNFCPALPFCCYCICRLRGQPQIGFPVNAWTGIQLTRCPAGPRRSDRWRRSSG